jgi:hypothetical protein
MLRPIEDFTIILGHVGTAPLNNPAMLLGIYHTIVRYKLDENTDAAFHNPPAVIAIVFYQVTYFHLFLQSSINVKITSKIIDPMKKNQIAASPKYK